MLKGIPEIIGSDLLKALADMGHGDILVIADHFYPPYSKSPNAVSIQAKGNTAPEMIDAILKLMPLDTEYCATPLEYMVPDADSGVEMEQCDTWDEAIEAAKRNGYENCAGPIERTKFYEKAGKAVLTVCTSETRPYGCFMLQKGVAGLVGAGRSEIMRALCGVEKRLSGDVYVKGKKVEIKDPAGALKNGIGFLTEDRRADGLALALPIKTNINMNSYEMISKGGIISLKKETERAEKYSKDVRVKTPSVMQLSGNLSGGNQQKVVIAKLLCRNPDILIFDEPTVGVDVGAKEEIYKIMEELTAQGKGIILISSYLPEVMGLSDRLFVMAQGRITGEFNYDEIKVLKEEDVLKKASVEG